MVVEYPLLYYLLKLNGDVYSFGKNEYGQLGLGDTSQRNTPTLVSHYKF